MAVIVGTAGNDILDGTPSADTISGLGGNDTINDFVGADVVDGGTGNDKIVLTATSGDLNGALNSQVIFVEAVTAAGAVDDVVINLGLQNEGFVITGGAYNDTITGGAGADTINAGAGDDTINGFVGTDTVNGGADNDTLTLSATSSTLNSATDAQLVGVENIDASGAGSGIALNLTNQSEAFTIVGSAFADSITGTAAADTIDAGEGDDTINTYNTGDTIEGGNGNDTLLLRSLASVDALNAADDAAISGIEAITVGSVGRGVTVDLHNQDDEGFRITATSYADVIIGANGNDTIVGFLGTDTVDGGDGDEDTIALTTTSIAMNVAADSDIQNIEILSAAGATSAVTINLSNQSEGFDIIGGSFSDTIIGTAAANEILAGAGSDTIKGFTAGDTIDGGANTDRLVLSDTSAALNAATDDDIESVEIIVFTGAVTGVTVDLQAQNEGFSITTTGFADTITGGEGADSILAGSGNDTINGFEGGDKIDVGSGIDTLVLAETSNDLNFALDNQITGLEIVTAEGALGDVTINLMRQSEGFTLTGGVGNDSIRGGAGADIIDTGDGDDTITNLVGADTVNGGTGNDTLVLIETSTALGAASDTQLLGVENVDASIATEGVVFSLANQTEGFTVTGSDFGDTMTGSAGVDTIAAGNGNDTIIGYTAGDSVDGEDGTDTLALKTAAAATALAGAGDGLVQNVEAVSAAGASAGLTIDLHNQSEGFSITGSKYADTIIGTDTDDTIIGFVGTDSVDGNGGTDTIALTATSKTLNAATDAAIQDVEAISAAGAAKAVAITLGNQTEGFGITGSNFSDTITGSAGADALTGGTGNDKLNGGLGDDTFVFNAGDGADIITGFVAGAATDDAFDLSSFGFLTSADVLALATDNGINTVINFGGGDTITLLGVTVAQLHDDDFILS